MSDQNQIDWEKGTIQEPNQIDWDNGQISQPKEKKEKGFLGQAKDHAISFVGKGTVAGGQMLVGLSDLMSDGATGKVLSEKFGYDPKATNQEMTRWQTPQLQEQIKQKAQLPIQKIEEEDDIPTTAGKLFNNSKEYLKFYKDNPAMISNSVAESLIPMGVGAALGRGTGIANPIVAASVGEGLGMAGSQAEQIRQETVDGRLTADQSLAGATTGVLGGLIGFAGGRLAQKMGIGDVDTMLVNGRFGPADIAGEIASMPAKSLPRRVIEGAISEGFLEELPQSVSEQVIQNLALDKPWHDGIEDAAVMGTLAGMAMGGAANIVSGRDSAHENNQSESNTPNSPSALPQLGSSPDNALTGEYIPRENVPQGDNQGRTAFVYDQPSMEADNLLNNNYKGDADFDTFGNFDPSNNPDSPLSPSGGNYFEDHSTQPQLPSERLGINPDDGPMSSAAALAVDSGTTSAMLNAPAVTDTKQDEINNNAPLSNAAGLLNAPTKNTNTSNSGQDESGLLSTTANSSGSESANDSSNNLERSGNSSVISNAIGDDGKDASGGINNIDSVSGIGEPSQATQRQSDRNNVNTVGNNSVLSEENTGTATSSSAIRAATGDSQSRTVDPILGADGQNKWFASQDKANAFIEKKKLNNDYQVVQNDKRFEIQPKTPVQDDAIFQSKLDQLDQQRTKFESTGDYENAEKVYDQMQKVSREWQNAHAKQNPTTKRPKPSKGVADQAWNDFYRQNRNAIGEELFMGGAKDRSALEGASPEIRSRHAHGMAKSSAGAAIHDLKDILENDIDPNRGDGRLYTAPLNQGKLTTEERGAMSAAGTSSGSAYSDGAFTLIAKEGVGDIRSVSEIDAVMVNSSIPQSVVEGLREDFPQMKFGYANELNGLLLGGKQSNNSQSHVTELEKQLANETSVIKKVRLRKQIAKLQKDNPIDQAAHAAATSIQNDLPEPTQAQIEAGNYKKGHIKVQGLDISIENPKGSERRGTDPNGNEWAHTMSDHYGYIKRTVGADSEQIDTYVGKNPDSDQVFIVDQIDQGTGGFDEHKVMLGFDSQEEAITAYKSNFDKGWKVGPIRNMDMDQFKDWLKNEDTSKPATQKNVKDSIENIRAEKIRQKDIADMHNSVYGLATDEQLQESLKHLNKEIKKAQKQSENEVVNGKRSTRKAVAAGALDRFLKNRVDLETYIKARQNGEVKQRNKKIDDYSHGKLKTDNERRGISPLDTTFTPLSVVSATRRVLSVLQHLKMSATQDASSRGRINVSLNNGIGVNKVGNVNSNGFGVQVISSFSDLPKVIQNDATYQNENGETKNYDVSGVWHDGTLYVVADQIYGDGEKQLTTYDAYEELLAHEIIGHFGVQQLFGQEYKTKFQQLFNALGKLEGIRKIAKDNGVDMQQFESAYIEPYTQGVKDEIYTESDVQQALVSELFAFIAQNAKSRPFVRQKLKEVIGYIRQWFRDRGFDKFLSRYNDADLMMFLSEARKAVIDQKYFGKYKNQEFSSKNNSDTPLYSRRTKSNSGSTTQQVRDVLIDRFGKETIDELERQGKLGIIQDYQVEGVEGFYYNGKAVLVASNLTAESTVPTFLHELGGHAGFQNMMNQKQYNELMNQFNKLVEQGNPVALAAKMLAEREQGSERQQLEYLPYLLTLSSTMQQRNVIQRNALQKLINNIVSYVKAWVFDNFGINLNLNPDDMLALSERMIGQIKHQSSLDLIRQKYHGTNQWMTAPNGAKTHLSEQQWLQVRTPEFKKWFGDWENDAANASQVLDENGEPKVVYHGTATEFNEFKQGHGLLGDGIYLTDSFDTVDVYANIRGENGFVLPLFVNIRNAFKTTGNVSRDEFVEATTSGKYQGIVHQFENKEYIVALEPNQVKMAEGNKGTFNSESSDIRFSRSSNDVADRLSENIKNLYSGNFKLPSMADAMKYGLMFLSRMQITDIYKAILPQLSVYNDLVRQMDADKNDIAAEADNIVREWSKLKDEEALANVMHEATLSQIDPAKPYQQGDDKLKYQQLLKKYSNLTPEAQVIYKKARNAYSKHYAKVREAVRERILRSALSSERKADLLKKIEGSFGQIKGVYFPLARFGKYVVVARNQNGDVESISRAETENEANALREQLIQKHPQLEIDSVIRDQEYNALRDKVGRGFMSDLFDEVGNLGLDAKKQAEFEDTLGQLYLSSMPDLSWAKHGMHRKGTAGFSQNARRAFAQNMSSGAGYLAKLRYGDQLVAQLDEMKEYAKAQIKKDPSYKQPLASAVIDEMNARHENLMNAKGNAISSLLTSMGFVYFLGLSPAAAMVNIMQTPLVAYPILGAKFGFDKAGAALIKASADYAKGVDFNMPDFTNLDSFRRSIGDSIDPDIAKILKDHEKQAYDKAISAGVIDVTQAHDLAGIAQGEDSGIMWKTRPIMRAASLMFHHAERFNREVTFIAAYRLSKESGMADNDAYKQAVKMTYDGHFDYSASNRARFMQGNVAKVVFLFKQFGQNMIYTIARQSYIALIGKNHTKEERIEAARAISAMLVTHALAAGVLGLPMVTTILAIASGLVGMAGGGDDDPWDAEVALRNGLADMTSPTFSNLVMKGLSRGTPADISGRVGLDSMFLAKTQDGLEGQKLYEQLIIGNLGATVGMGANIAKGIQELGQGNYARALEEMLPTFAKNPFKAYRYATEGVQDKTGVDILDGNPVSGAGIFSQTIGFSPSQVRTAYEGKSAIYQQQQALQKRKFKLTANWVRAKRNDDQEGMDSAWKDIQEFNEVNPKLRINRINLMQSYHQNAKRIRDAENGVYLPKKYSDIGDYGRFAETD